MRLIEANELKLKLLYWQEQIAQSYGNGDEYVQCLEDVIETYIENAPIIDAVPVNELLKLRDWLYESDGIRMGGLRSLNELIAKYSSTPLPRIENGFERRNDDCN